MNTSFSKKEETSFQTDTNKNEIKNINNKEEIYISNSISTVDKSHSSVEPNKIQETSQLFPIEFIWNSEKESKEVLLTCSYLNWSKTYLMKNDINNSKIFKYILYLPEGEYEYKFIVDGKSCIMENQPKKENKDKNIINNIINIKKIEKNKKEENKKEEKKIINKKEKKEEIYDSKYNLEFDLIVPSMSNYYNKLFEFKDEEKIMKDSYINIKKDKVPNVFINHIMLTNLNKNKTYTTYSITNRAKKKFVSFVYYQPLSKN